MHDTAAHLVDRVLPRVPVRQWVLSRGRDRAEQGDEEEDKQEKPAPSAPLRPI